MKWTREQEQAIFKKGSPILVSAAAGSGKTAVLVERIIHKIITEKIDISSLLVVTFTNASASEMRERILDAIYKKLEEDPENIHLQRQITLLGKANICTIHAFCLEVIRNYFYEIALSPNFRIGDSAEIELLKQDVLEDVFEEKYLAEEESFLNLLEAYTGYRGDEPLKELVLRIYRYIQSSPFPEEWLQENVEKLRLQDIEKDFSETEWGKILLKETADLIEETQIGLLGVKKDLEENPELEKFSNTLFLDIQNLEELKANLETWDKAYLLVTTFSFTKWPIDRKIQSEIKEEAKKRRDKINKKFNLQRDSIFLADSKQANEDIATMYPILKNLQKLIQDFSEKFTQKKRDKNLIDFNDIEHLALKILTEKKEDGTHGATWVARSYQKQFEEIAIDEYQDSNLVQEYLLNAISRGNNIFMVGDVKQSIYKFRQARPELFLNKYETYQLEENKEEKDGLKIQLFKNFRSRSNILNTTNSVFQNIMTKELGDINYTQEEYLNLGASFKEEGANLPAKYETEMHFIELQETEEQLEEIPIEEEEERVENTVLEARLVTNKIQELIENKFQILDKKSGNYRDITYKDIVILLRTTRGVAPVYEKEISEKEIPVFSDTSSEYLDSVEIQTIMSILKILDNPMQDIPLVTVLRSIIGGFSDNDLMEIRLVNRTANFYEAMLEARIQVSKELKEKIERFLNQIEKWRSQQEYLALDELIWKIYQETGYYHYVGLMPNGHLRQANLKMLFERAKQYEKASFKGLFQFINFIDKLKMSSGDLSSAKLIGENENVVRIMSIHKSKGLEFPIVFLCGTGKNFNLQDLNDTILLHQELGLAPKYISSEEKIEYDTLAKEAMKRKLKKETMAEEMRILYVALTRAKEKLIITGLGKDIEKELEERKKIISLYQKAEKLPFSMVGSFKKYKDWMELVYLKEEGKNLNLQIHSKKEILQDKKEEKEERDIIADWKKESKVKQEEKEKLEKWLNWKYPYELAKYLPSKVSVTELKELANKRTTPFLKQEQNKSQPLETPQFRKEEKVTAAERGTVTHLCLQRLNIQKEYELKDIEEEIEELVAKKIITRKEAEVVSSKEVLGFTKTKLWQEMKLAKRVEKELPFYRSVPAKQLYQEESEEEILVQGIIDLFYITKDNEIVLVDYKTDYIKTPEELTRKYREQLSLYKNALEEALGEQVERVYLYSTCLGKEVKVVF